MSDIILGANKLDISQPIYKQYGIQRRPHKADNGLLDTSKFDLVLVGENLTTHQWEDILVREDGQEGFNEIMQEIMKRSQSDSVAQVAQQNNLIV